MEKIDMTEEPKNTAVQKRKQTLAKKANAAKVVNQYTEIAALIPSAWVSNEQEKLALLGSIHKDVIGLDKQGDARPLNDLKYFMFQCAQRNLNPFKGQIHAVYIYDKTKKGEQLVVITGIGGFRSIAQRSKRPLYAGSGEPVWEMDENSEYPKKATVQIFAYNPVTGAREAIATGIAWWEEFKKEKEIWENNQKTGQFELNPTWKKSPKLMLAKCAEALGLRIAFPEELSGMYVEEEIDHLRDNPDVIEGDIALPTEDEQAAKVTDAVAKFNKKAK